jgi:chromosomal replication initiation ATPase DnaA
MAKSQFDIDNNSNAQPEVAANATSTAAVQSPSNPYVAKVNDTVTIADPSPVIILFGSLGSGKTMTLIRLTRYLMQQGYKVQPERTFRDARDTYYQKMCNDFISIVNSTKAPGGNAVIDFMLVKVMDNWGRPICQLLEAPGEHYFDEKAPQRPFPAYINTINQSNNRRTWVFIVEKDWKNQQDRGNFALKIQELQQQYVLTQDKVIFTCHKADLHGQYMAGGRYNIPLYFQDIHNQYPGIFSKYENTNPITKLWRKYNFDFVVFSAGSFSDDGGGGQNYVPSNPANPALLWKSILKTVQGGW